MAGPLLCRVAEMPRTSLRSLGFTLIELLVVMALIVIMAGVAVPILINVADGIKLSQATREVERELQTARLRAVSANQPMRVRFNCPAAGEYRSTELIGTPSVPAAADSAVDRCSPAVYPFPGDADKKVLTRPNQDGPLRRLDSSVTFSTVTTIEFWPDGTARTNTGGTNPWPPISGTGFLVTLTKGPKSRTILVNGVGKIQIQ
jgi:prepilin-type N-terminal cleavage/methylation domain-containing protein